MFWALKGATLSPRRASRRQTAAASRLLPALEQVPWNIRAGTAALAETGAGAASGSAKRGSHASFLTRMRGREQENLQALAASFI